MSQRKIFTTLIILIAIILVGIAGYYFYFGQVLIEQPKSEKPSEKFQNSAEIDTSDWPTFRNEKYGYEIRYPKDSEVRGINEITGYYENPNQSSRVGIIIPPFSDTYAAGPTITIIENVNTRNLSLREWFVQNVKNEKGVLRHYRTQSPTIEREMIINSHFVYYTELFGYDDIYVYIYLMNDNKVYEISGSKGEANDPYYKEHQRIFNTMLETLRFLE